MDLDQEAPGDPMALGHVHHFSSEDMFGSDLYYISFLGTPLTTQPWML